MSRAPSRDADQQMGGDMTEDQSIGHSTPPQSDPTVSQGAAAERSPTLTGRGMRARLARIGTGKSQSNPELEPLFRVVRANHPRADLALL
ncbi:MAG TPA: hypothetical protein PKE34_09695, partial [Marmoricola sp.]|nr:hypothetical protein [Marmoricola sp.]